MSRNYERLPIEKFGRHLITTGDLDPIHNGLVGAVAAGVYTQPQLYCWLIAYWCFYHAGVASFMSGMEGQEFAIPPHRPLKGSPKADARQIRLEFGGVGL